MDYWLHLVILLGIYASLGVSLNLAAGQTGMLSIAHAALFGIGAYGTAILTTRTGAPLVVVLPVSMLLSGVAALPLALAAVRLRSDHFVVASLAYQALLSSLFENWTGLTGGPLGIAAIPRRILADWMLSTNMEFATLALAIAGFTSVIVWRLSKGPFGRVLHCIRDDEIVALSLGKNVRRVKAQVLTLSGAMAGAAGSLYAVYATFVDPSSFTLSESIAIAAMAIVGGLRTTIGPVAGAGVFVLLPEFLRFFGFPDVIAASLNRAIFGAALVWIMLARPQGLIGTAAKEPDKPLRRTST
jgi:branched-chain amino acid transport system permease protein